MNTDFNDIILIAYSGHGYVACDIILSQSGNIIGYCDKSKKENNPYNLEYIGTEKEEKALNLIRDNNYFTAIGNNLLRSKVNAQVFNQTQVLPSNIIHKSATVSNTAQLGHGTMISGGCHINACAYIGDGVICNTQSVIEHECRIGNYVHIAPGAVLCGDVDIGAYTFVGARTVIKQGVRIGNNVTIGAGTVIIKDIPDYSTVVGNPQRYL